MAAWTLETAKAHLQAWLDADLAVSTGQSYQMGSRQLTRADLAEVRKQIAFWRNEVTKLESNRTRRVMRVVPRDL